MDSSEDESCPYLPGQKPSALAAAAAAQADRRPLTAQIEPPTRSFDAENFSAIARRRGDDVEDGVDEDAAEDAEARRKMEEIANNINCARFIGGMVGAFFGVIVGHSFSSGPPEVIIVGGFFSALGGFIAGMLVFQSNIAAIQEEGQRQQRRLQLQQRWQQLQNQHQIRNRVDGERFLPIGMTTQPFPPTRSDLARSTRSQPDPIKEETVRVVVTKEVAAAIALVAAVTAVAMAVTTASLVPFDQKRKKEQHAKFLADHFIVGPAAAKTITTAAVSAEKRDVPAWVPIWEAKLAEFDCRARQHKMPPHQRSQFSAQAAHVRAILFQYYQISNELRQSKTYATDPSLPETERLKWEAKASEVEEKIRKLSEQVAPPLG